MSRLRRDARVGWLLATVTDDWLRSLLPEAAELSPAVRFERGRVSVRALRTARFELDIAALGPTPQLPAYGAANATRCLALAWLV